MRITEPVKPYFQWLLSGGELGLGALGQFLIGIAALLGIGLLIGYAVAAFRQGPVTAFDTVGGGLLRGGADLFRISPRRIWALSKLAFLEAFRRRVWVVFVIFALLAMFAGWFLDPQNSSPYEVYVGFVMTSTTYLMMALVLFLSTFSLPADIQQRTIFTVATKPVRFGEIVLGRMLGFGGIATLMMLILFLLRYVFVWQGLRHEHQVMVDSVEEVDIGHGKQAYKGTTSYDRHHRHSFTVGPDGRGSTSEEMDHRHVVERIEEDGQVTYRVGPPDGVMQARVPVYGRLIFLDRTGQPKREGINVGYEDTYRSYVEGQTLSAAIWTFDAIRQERYPNGLPVEWNIRVFRTYKGDVEQGIRGKIFLRNVDDPSVRSKPHVFTAKEDTTNSRFFPLQLDADPGMPGYDPGRQLDLFDDLVNDQGQVEVIVQCIDGEQYLGVAQADLYLRLQDSSFFANLFKSFLAIWMQLMLVIAFGVTLSTILSAPIAMLTTLGTIILGRSADFIFGVASGEIEGGGPIESLIKLFTQKGVTIPLEEGFTTDVVHMVDRVLNQGMSLLAYVLPRYGYFSATGYIKEGFYIPADLVAQLLTITLAYVLVLLVAGYFLLRSRELAS